jgi:hypothetical protein
MTSAAPSVPTTTAAPPTPSPIRARIIETMRVIVVAGIPYGAIVVGFGSRLCMLILRLTSSERVIGIRSDDDFVIGRFTLAGTYNLMILGAAVGIIGVGACLLVAPRLIGPSWFRHLTVGLASGAVGGAMLIHPNGVDFTRLTPTWLAITLFVALPGLFGAFIGPTVTGVSAEGSWTRRGKRRWAIPLVAMACFPPAIPVVLVATLVVAALTAIASIDGVESLRGSQMFSIVIRAAWLLIAVTGLRALIIDIQHLT